MRGFLKMSNATVAPEKTEGKVLTEKDLNK